MLPTAMTGTMIVSATAGVRPGISGVRCETRSSASIPSSPRSALSTPGGWSASLTWTRPRERLRASAPRAPAGSTWIRWEPGRRYIVRQVPEADGAWCLCREPALWWREAPEPEALLITSPARFADADPEPAVPAWSAGSDGVGPALQAPDGAPVRWLLMDGYVYDIRADQTQPPWQEGRWAVNEWRPQPWREILADPLEEM